MNNKQAQGSLLTFANQRTLSRAPSCSDVDQVVVVVAAAAAAADAAEATAAAAGAAAAVVARDPIEGAEEAAAVHRK